ncbi:MAG: adenylate/guanylate cyclase domain-containing protein, partial [Chlamydiae bacterium]|nr:adenylate/guanylate cyclase domain-containing protein [Chlamydiota bacterium]
DLTWYVAIILPFHDIFGNFISIEYIKNWISVALVALFGVFIYFSSKKIAKPIVLLAKNVDKIRNFEFDNPFPVTSRISEIITLSSSLSSMRSALKSFSKYLPKEIVKSLVRQGHDISTGGERRDLTILFSDIENFTTISESLKIEELTIYLSQYFGVFSKIINGTSGTVDKFIGDAMMAFWNAPEAVLDQGDKACISALKFFKHIQDFKTENPLFRAKTRFGIHSGETIVGNIGTEDRMNYTVIGNVVNTTSRLEGLNKVYGTHILISETTHEKIGLRFLTRPIDFIVVKGRTQGITIYELLGTNDIEPEIKASEKQKQLCELFSVAFQLYHAGKMEEAKSEFLKIFQLFPQDQPTLMYLSRLGVNTTSLAHE